MRGNHVVCREKAANGPVAAGGAREGMGDCSLGSRSVRRGAEAIQMVYFSAYLLLKLFVEKMRSITEDYPFFLGMHINVLIPRVVTFVGLLQAV